MATIEKNTLIKRKDNSGNVEIHYPLTELTNVPDLNELITNATKIKDVVGEFPAQGLMFAEPVPFPMQYYFSSIRVGSKIYIIGGNTDASGGIATRLTSMYIYDTVTQIWYHGPPMPLARDRGGVAAIGDKIYVVGGRVTGYTYYDPVPTAIYDIGGSTWSLGANLPIYKGLYSTIRTVGNKIYIAGGEGSSHDILPVVMYDTVTDKWTVGPELNYFGESSGYPGIVVDDKIYFIQGRYDNQTEAYQRILTIYDTVSNTATLGSRIPNSHDMSAGVHIDGKLYIIGGTSDGSISIYDIAKNEWVSHNGMPGGTYTQLAHVIGKKIYVFWIRFDLELSGGADHRGSGLGVYDIESNTWSEEDFSSQTTLSPLNARTSSLIDSNTRKTYVLIKNKLVTVHFRGSDVSTTLDSLSALVESTYSITSVCGTYVGNGNTSSGQTIYLDFRPSAVIIGQMDTYTTTINPFVGTILTTGTSTCKLSSGGSALPTGETTAEGFVVYGNGYMTNASGRTYYYIAYK